MDVRFSSFGQFVHLPIVSKTLVNCGSALVNAMNDIASVTLIGPMSQS